ncbi:MULTISPECIES: DUF7504 family protein [Halorussus]|uniref:DUF7504 family protein n=1 Tax=Halorussus TaxID=1070314 RepID=UPI0020A0E20A|nr:hypothetical protein [Halorussus vallis]USZ75977.1 hypothetical protein NGM07_01325 [Halorussus vallis]
MARDRFHIWDSECDTSFDDDFSDFLHLLNELKAIGCNILVVGEAPRCVFTRASAHLLGGPETVRHHLLAVTDVAARSVADRLPDPESTPRPLGETTHVVNYAASVRSVTSPTDPATPPEVAGVPETRIEESDLERLEATLVESIDEFTARAVSPRSAELRVAVDSLEPLVARHGEAAVGRLLRAVGASVCEANAMAHYVLPEPYDSETVRALAEEVDAVAELRAVDPAEYGHDAQERWHVPGRDLTMDWTPL